MNRTFARAAGTLAAAVAAAATTTVATAQTPIDEVVMYGIDADTNELLRYEMNENNYERIGVMRDQHGDSLVDVEGLCWIPEGPNKGLYCAPNDGPSRDKLVRINIMTGACTAMFSANLGASGVDAMIAMKDAGQWKILASERGSNKLVWIDPASGTSTTAANMPRSYSGLARGPQGTFYATMGQDLYRINPSTGEETHVGDTGYVKVEALEYGFGDNTPDISVPGVSSDVTANGILWGFSDGSDALLIVDPSNGSTVTYPCAFATVDCEGIVFMTKKTDPRNRDLRAIYEKMLFD